MWQSPVAKQIYTFTCKQGGRIEDKCWCEYHMQKFEFQCWHVSLIHMLHLHKYTLQLCSCISFNYMFKNFQMELIPRSSGNRCWNMQIVVSEREYVLVVLSVKYMQSSNFLLMCKKKSSVLLFTLLYYLCCTGKVRIMRDMGIYFI
jgi:hypothetical protein